MSIGNRYSRIMRKTLLIPLIIIIVGIVLYHTNTYEVRLLWIGVITLDLAPLLGLLLLLTHYVKVGDKKTVLMILVIVLFILINILINLFS
ncbi:MAG: hypothetical protein DRJ45_00310 [Thermoprotei archaeon]|nr:MAG: hypothetical protein DRJ45_00310 [Thermoprotei archaeon]